MERAEELLAEVYGENGSFAVGVTGERTGHGDTGERKNFGVGAGKLSILLTGDVEGEGEQQLTQELQTLKTLRASAGITGFAECAEIAGIAGTARTAGAVGITETRGLQGRHPEGSASRLRLFHQF
ncbi:MAG: hypothetical protein ACLR6I_15710 [Waltera sp.]